MLIVIMSLIEWYCLKFKYGRIHLYVNTLKCDSNSVLKLSQTVIFFFEIFTERLYNLQCACSFLKLQVITRRAAENVCKLTCIFDLEQWKATISSPRIDFRAGFQLPWKQNNPKELKSGSSSKEAWQQHNHQPSMPEEDCWDVVP